MISRKNAYVGAGIPLVILVFILGSGCLEKAPPSDTLPDYAELARTGKSCNDCHYTVFNSLSAQGGKHSGDCTFCHVQHGFKPECSHCHVPVHGPDLQICTDCHNVHIPMQKITGRSGTTFENSCSICHSRQFEDFSEFPGRHADIKCVYCHLVHRQTIPCINCHAPHSTGLTYYDCLTCHPSHMPHEVEYPGDIRRETCAVCHDKENTTLEEGGTKHAMLQCAFCHPAHKEIPECMSCHNPHVQEMTDEDCTSCHPAHDPLTMVFSPATRDDHCTICHEEINEILRESETKHDDLGCLYCHPEHRLLPTCESCHDSPHNKDIHDSFPSCNQCHINSHAVNEIIFSR